MRRAAARTPPPRRQPRRAACVKLRPGSGVVPSSPASYRLVARHGAGIVSPARTFVARPVVATNLYHLLRAMGAAAGLLPDVRLLFADWLVGRPPAAERDNWIILHSSTSILPIADLRCAIFHCMPAASARRRAHAARQICAWAQHQPSSVFGLERRDAARWQFLTMRFGAPLPPEEKITARARYCLRVLADNRPDEYEYARQAAPQLAVLLAGRAPSAELSRVCLAILELAPELAGSLGPLATPRAFCGARN